MEDQEETMINTFHPKVEYFRKISLNLIVYILEFVSFREYENYLFLNLRFVRVLQKLISANRGNKSFKKKLLNKSFTVFFNLPLYQSYRVRILPFLNTIEGFKKLVFNNCREILLYCLEIKKFIDKGVDPFEQLLESIAMHFNKNCLEKGDIKKLDLSQLLLGKNGCYIISHLMDANQSLSDISLVANDLGYEEIYMLFSQFRQNKHYLRIDLRKNRLDVPCLTHISNLMKDDLYKTIVISKTTQKLPKTANGWTNIVQY